MNIKTIEDERPILKCKESAIINLVSCDGVMSTGIGSVLRFIYPDMYSSFKSACRNKQFILGSVILWRKTNPWIINIPIKKDLKGVFEKDSVITALSKISSAIQSKSLPIESLAIESCRESLIIKNLAKDIDLPDIKIYETKTLNKD